MKFCLSQIPFKCLPSVPKPGEGICMKMGYHPNPSCLMDVIISGKNTCKDEGTKHNCFYDSNLVSWGKDSNQHLPLV